MPRTSWGQLPTRCAASYIYEASIRDDFLLIWDVSEDIFMLFLAALWASSPAAGAVALSNVKWIGVSAPIKPHSRASIVDLLRKQPALGSFIAMRAADELGAQMLTVAI